MIRSYDLRPGEKDTYVFLPFAVEDLPGAPSAAISLKSAGDLSLGTPDGGLRRRLLLDSLGIDVNRVDRLRQIHSKRVFVFPESGRSPGKRKASEVPKSPDGAEAMFGLLEGDGLVSIDSNRVLSVIVADCLPIFLYDAREKVLALVHSGWRGTGICIAALSMMRERYGTKAADVHAIVGPGIGPCCYNVDNERASYFSRSFGPHSVAVRGGEIFLDLGLVNEKLLDGEGVASILRVSNCTSCSPFLGSFRRQGADDYTHMLALFGSFG